MTTLKYDDGYKFESEDSINQVLVHECVAGVDTCIKALMDMANLGNLIHKAGANQVIPEPTKLRTASYLSAVRFMIPVAKNEDDVKQIMKLITGIEENTSKACAQVESARKEVVKVVERFDEKVKKDAETKKKEDEKKKALEDRETKRKADKDARERAKTLTAGGTPEMEAFNIASSCIKPMTVYADPAEVKTKGNNVDLPYALW